MRIGFLHQPNDSYTIVRMKYFISRGHDVYSITFPKKTKQKVLPGLTIITLPQLFLYEIPFFKRVAFRRRILKITKEKKLDVFHIVNALNSFYLKYSHAKMSVLECEGSDVIRTPKKYPFIKLYYKYYFKYADCIIQDSQLSKNSIMNFYKKRYNNETIEIGVNLSIFNKNVQKGIAREKLAIGDEPIVFHSRGLSKIYNIDTINKCIPHVKAVFKNVRFVFAGNKGDLSKHNLKLINGASKDKSIIFTGRLDHEKDIKYFYRDADVVISVPTSDSSPCSVYESMATMTPVVATDLPWLYDKFIPGQHLITIPVRDEKALANTIVMILKGKITVDLESAYKIVESKINMRSENARLEKLSQSHRS